MLFSYSNVGFESVVGSVNNSVHLKSKSVLSLQVFLMAVLHLVVLVCLRVMLKGIAGMCGMWV